MPRSGVRSGKLISRRRMIYYFLPQFAICASSFAVVGQMSTLASRDAPTCPSAKLPACPSNIPFCCPTGTVCLALTPDKSSVLCCPEGKDCSILGTVSCNVSLQNPNKHPGLLLQTLRLHSALPQCGENCCPFGYSCQDSHCVMNNPPKSTQSSPSTTHGAPQMPTSSGEPVIVPTAAAEPSAPEYPAKAVVLGLFIGILVGIALTFLMQCLFKRCRSKSKLSPISRPLPHNRDPSESGAAKPESYVSVPVGASEYGGPHTIDFLRTPERNQSQNYVYTTPEPPPPKRPTRSDEFECRGIDPQLTGSTAAISNGQAMNRHDSDETHISTGTSDRDSRDERTASTETINVLMPPPLMAEGGPNGRGVSTNTTFSAMMERAGMKRGYGYAEYPGRWSMTKR